MSIADRILLRKRALIETANDELKNITQIEHSRHRSFSNFIANSLSAIAAYCFFEKKPAIEVNFINDGQLTIFCFYRTHVRIMCSLTLLPTHTSQPFRAIDRDIGIRIFRFQSGSLFHCLLFSEWSLVVFPVV